MNAATAVSTTTVVRQGPSPIQEIPLATIRESRTNPCRHFDEAKLAELANNIKRYGVLQPILLRPAPSGASDRYELVAGERRYRASKLAGRDTIPATIRELTDTQCLEIQLIENGQRDDVHPLDEAQGYARLMNLEPETYTVEAIAPSPLTTSPGLRSATSPTNSWPITRGTRIVDRAHSSHSWICRSVPQMPVTSTRIRTSLMPNSGTGTSSSQRPGSGRLFTSAFISALAFFREIKKATWVSHRWIRSVTASGFSSHDRQGKPDCASQRRCLETRDARQRGFR